MATKKRTAPTEAPPSPDPARGPAPPKTSVDRPVATVTHLVPKRITDLVCSPPQADTISLLRELLRQAEAGALAGLVIVQLYKPGSTDRRYDMSLSGLAVSHPTLAVGAVDVCHMLLREAALKDAGFA